MTDLVINHDRCTMCGKTGARRCVRCKSIHYCSKDCQRDDWPLHKLLCQSIATFEQLNPRPSKDHIMGIFFPEDVPNPQLTWVECSWITSTYDDRYLKNVADYKPLFRDELPWNMDIVQDDILRQELLTEAGCIRFFFRRRFTSDGSRSNRSIETVLQTVPRDYFDWRGPFLALGLGRPIVSRALDTEYRDMNMADFRHLADHLIYFGTGTPQPVITWRPMNLWRLFHHSPYTKSARGATINCLGDRQVLGKPQYEPAQITCKPTDEDIDQQFVSNLSVRLGLPIITQRCEPSLRWVGERPHYNFKGKSPYDNPAAASLHLGCDPEDPGWSLVSPKWQNQVGSVTAIRQDLKPLFPLHLEALCLYCRDEVQPLMAQSHGKYDPSQPFARDYVLQMISRPMFMIFWQKFVEQKRKEGRLVSGVSPYDI
jgi:hypothetical protein